MSTDLMQTVQGIIEKRGREAVEKARAEILSSQYDGGVVSSALKYFARVTLQGGLPVFPALTSLSCDAVGGQTEKTTSIAAALTLIAGAADVHDDIIDRSSIKYTKKTVFGKFGEDIALLAGDALLAQGFVLLHKECKNFSEKQSNAILDLIASALLEISNAEAKETLLMRKPDASPEDYREVLVLKAVVPEVHCKIGAIIGNASEESVKALGQYGRIFGIASGIRDEFIDMLEYAELQSRIKNECLPIPMLYALQNPVLKKEIMPLIESLNKTTKQAPKLVKTVLNSDEVKQLRSDLNLMVCKEIKLTKLSLFKQETAVQKEALLLLHISIDGI